MKNGIGGSENGKAGGGGVKNGIGRNHGRGVQKGIGGQGHGGQ